MSNPYPLAKLKQWRDAIAETVPLTPLSYPLFERLDEEVRKAELLASTDPLARARALARGRDQMAIS